MDSDLSLLEIAVEDESLLQIPGDDSGFNTTSTIFSCSPLHCHRSLPALASQTEGRVGAVGFQKLSCPAKDSINKENINGNKSESPKLNVEPQQMKRKKKGGGYNLRKSLAWNQAFFTEEGVLNPLELSMISGNRSTANNELTMIDEEENALVGDEDIAGASSVPQDIEENLFKPLPEERKIGASLSISSVSDALTKDMSASVSLAKRKVLAVNNINRNRSKRDACPGPIASSSRKRHDTSKARRKESKVSKIPVLKTHVPVLATTARSGALSTVCSKRNEHDRPAAYVHKNAVVKGPTKNPKSVPTDAKFDDADKSSVSRTSKRQAGKDINDSVSKSHPPPRLQYHPVSEARKGSELHPSVRVCNTGDKKKPTQFQTARPSGLRMPSPSLGFFSQQKASSSHSIFHKSSKPCKPDESNIPKLKKVETDCVNEARGLRPTDKSTEMVKGERKNCTPKSGIMDVTSGPSLQVENNHRTDVQCYFLGSEEITEQGKVERIPEHVNNKPCKNENVLFMENTEFHTNDKNLLLGSDMDDHLKTKVDEDQFKEPRSMCYSSIQGTSTWRDDLSTHNAIEHEVDVQMKPLGCDAQISNEGLVPQGENGSSSKDSRHSGDLKDYCCMKIARVNSSLGDSSEAVLDVSLKRIPCKSTEGVKDGVGDLDKHGVDTQVHLLNANLSSHCSDSSQLIPEAANQQFQYFHSLGGGYEEQSETMNSRIEGEINSGSECESHVNGRLVLATASSSQESPKRHLLEVIGACGTVSKIAKMEDCKHTRDVQSGSVYRRSIDNEYHQLIDAKFIKDISSRGISLHYDLSISQHDVLEDMDQKARMITFSKTNYTLCENESSVANHSLLLDESNSIEASANINSGTKDFLKEAETASGPHEYKLLAQTATESDDAKRQIENLHVKDTSVTSFDENTVTRGCSNNSGTSLGKHQFPLVVESINKESPPELERTGLVADVDFLYPKSDGDLLPANNACSEEIKSEILFDGLLEQCNNNATEDIISKHHIQAASKIKDGSLDRDERTKHSQMDGADQVTAAIVEVDPNHIFNESNVVGSTQGYEGRIVDWKCNERCSLSVGLKSQVADNLISYRQIPKSSEAGSLKRKSLSEEAESSVPAKDEISDANVRSQIAEDSGEIFHLKKSGNKRKQNVPTVIPPPNATPFSDEWLAVMEAAGEGILTMKGGAVQNSPTDKPQHEPGPWSPKALNDYGAQN
ncbi:uncharacterized protein LOC129315239 isoform X2 [Prosopis cineraria]|uniref:uncharacterized protein LOC129315239 isoform X2 n=1 Tax=Prosopis cineraria TaxID=364024 RepID=UPI00240F7946|nr:uncharacterized protein LOC129315239 isoform X2 [Prosopis cineraria]